MQLVLDSVSRCAAAWQRDRGDNALERTRAAALAAPLRRAQFLAGRWLASQLLAQCCGGQPTAWQLTCVGGEAPRVASGPGTARPCLSIAHRGDMLACALADVPIGVDIEVEGSLRSAADERAAFVLAPCEQEAFERTAPDVQASFLLARWTLKEAWAKRSGRGLALGEMRSLATRELVGGGNARLWAARGLVVALCTDTTPSPWPQPRGLGMDRVSPQFWQVDPVSRPR